ncbi:MAG: outer membrane protein assembly factor BamD [Deltaproteobacteria bacterium]|nr:outer membrane protein assembly factor BamD [Deltaproteobacteria bacterium]
MPIKKLRNAIPLLIITLALISGCSLFKSNSDVLDEPPETLVKKGMKQFSAGRYEEAVEIFQRLRDRHPYSRYALLAELKLADAQFLRRKYPEAVEAYKEFERLHPKNEAVPYVIFQQGMCYYHQMRSLDRDQEMTVQAIRTFSRLRETFPRDPYAAKAEARLIEAQNRFAGHEFYIGEFYYKKKEYRAALGRFTNLVKSYPDTGYHGRAMAYISDIRKKLAAQEEANRKKQNKKAPPPQKKGVDKPASRMLEKES